MSLLSPIPAAHRGPYRSRDAELRAWAAKVCIIKARAEAAHSLAEALTEIAQSGDTDANMTEAANMLLAIERASL